MIVLDCKQLGPEWFAARAGVPSASNFDKIVTTKGEPSAQAKNYMYQLAGERLTGAKTETHQSAAMQRGIELEAEARSLYELMTDETVQTVGICYPNEDKKYSCSPDGLVGEDGGTEIKCPLIHTHVGYLLDGKLPTAYFQQVHGSMLVAGRKWWDFMSYYPGIKPFIIRVQRDEQFCKKLHAQLIKFCMELDKTVGKLMNL